MRLSALAFCSMASILDRNQGTCERQASKTMSASAAERERILRDIIPRQRFWTQSFQKTNASEFIDSCPDLPEASTNSAKPQQRIERCGF